MFTSHIAWHGAGWYACRQEGESVYCHQISGDNASERSEDARRCGLGTPSFYKSKEEWQNRTGGIVDFDYEEKAK